MSEAMRARVLRAARAWIGTPYRHRASVIGAGADCLGLVRGVWRDVVGAEPETLPVYEPDWMAGDDALGVALARHFLAVPLDEAVAGDVLAFRFRADGPVRHVAILSGGGRMIHAYSGHAVAETALGPWWLRRRAGAFRFPDSVIPAEPA